MLAMPKTINADSRRRSPGSDGPVAEASVAFFRAILAYPIRPRIIYKVMPKAMAGIDIAKKVPRQPRTPAMPAAISGARKKLPVPPI